MKNLFNKIKILFSFRSILLISGIIISYLILNITFSWSLINSLAERFYGDQFICQQVNWSGLGEISLWKCLNKKDSFSVKKITLSLIGGKLFIDTPQLKFLAKAQTTKKRFPAIPRLINEIIIKNLNFNVSNQTSTLIPNKFEYIKLNRQKLSLKNNWIIEAYDQKQTNLKGLIGDEFDLIVTLSNYPLKLNTLETNITCVVNIKTEYIFQKPIEVLIRDCKLNNVKIKSPKVSKSFPDILIKSAFKLNKDLNNITELSRFNLFTNNIHIVNSNNNLYEFKLVKTSAKNLKPFIQAFQKELKLNSFNIYDGLVSAELKLNHKDILQSNLQISLKSFKTNLRTSTQEFISISNLDIETTLLPFHLSQYLAKYLSDKKTNSVNEKSISQLLNNFGIKQINLDLSKSKIDKNITDTKKSKNILGKFSTFIEGNLFYDNSLQHLSKFNGLFLLSDLFVSYPQQVLNQDLKIQNGNGNIKINNENISLSVNATRNNTQNNMLEKVLAAGSFQVLPVFKGNVQVSIPNINLYIDKNLPKQFSFIDADFKNIILKAKILAPRFTVTELVGKIDQIQIGANQNNSFPSNKGTLSNINLRNGRIQLNKNAFIEIKDLALVLPNGQIVSSIVFPLFTNYSKSFKKANSKSDAELSENLFASLNTSFMPQEMEFNGLVDMLDIQELFQLYFGQNISDQLKNYQLLGKADLKAHWVNNRFELFDLTFVNNSLKYKGNTTVTDFNGKVLLSKNNELILKELRGIFNIENKFKINGNFNLTSIIKALKSKDLKDSLINNSELSINAFVNPQNLNEYFAKINPSFTPSLLFDHKVYIPLHISFKPKSREAFDILFSSNFHKLQLYKGKIFLAQDMSKIENITAVSSFNYKSKSFKITDLFYSGKDFGILFNAKGILDKFDFSFESSPLLDIGEIAKLWSDDYASGQFRGKIIAKDFEPKNKSTWIRNLESHMYSEEDVHDFQYGILYGKYFKFDMKTEKGDGYMSLQTLKGKVKNLQITNLNSIISIKDGATATLNECSLETADGKAYLEGDIDLQTGKAYINGALSNVNVETINNNLFGNLGDYNGKGNLTYQLKGNFASLLKSSRPDSASGEFDLTEGTVKQVGELSKGLHLANLVYGGPLYFSFDTINHILKPQQDISFLSIKGKWNFLDPVTKVILQDTVYIGGNALHLSLNGDWDFVNKDVDLNVYGFLPKRPTSLNFQDIEISQITGHPRYSLLQTANASRHFRFKVNGNMKNPNSLKNSVKNSIKFIDQASTREITEKFLPDEIPNRIK